jgi:tetratricopeptide (TPR) repeat protein
MRILFLTANPVDVITRLRVEKEYREIEKNIRLGTYRDQLEPVPELAVRPSDLQEALQRHQPDIVHFSGHCSSSGGLILEDEAGMRKVISTAVLADLLRLLKGNLRLVVLNACYGQKQAQALAEVVDFTISVNGALEDSAAIIFSGQLYQSLSFGKSLKEAFESAKIQLDVEGIELEERPILLEREGTNAACFKLAEATEEVAACKAQVRPAFAFLPWLLASLALGLTTDVLRRFLDDGLPALAAITLQFAFILLAIIAAVVFLISLTGSGNALIGRAASASRKPLQDLRTPIILTGIALVVVLGIWFCLGLVARYYNERGIRFQYREEPDLTHARESYEQAVRLKPSYAPAHYNLATLQEDLQPVEAIKEYFLAIRYDSHIYPAYNNLARLYLLRGKDNDYDSALDILSRAVDLSPQDENVSYSLNKNLGWANYSVKHYAMAEVYLRKAISLRGEQGGAAAHCLLAYVLKEQGKSGVEDECFDCVSLAPGERDVEAKWLSDAQECLKKDLSDHATKH